jgi:NADP-dependent aldehyde dehydrogenase
MTTNDELDRVCTAAASAAADFAATPAARRAELLIDIAERLDADSDALVALAHDETHLGAGRLAGEVTRTTTQLRAFAGLLTGAPLGRVDDQPDGFPQLRRFLVPLGPVAVFAASNFPFAFSVAGGDTASALAAGCPVVLKAHPGHPKLSRATAQHVSQAVDAAGLPAGVFGLVEEADAGAALVQHPAIAAVGFTGSTAGGRALFDLAAGRPDPIPFFGELGSVNPVYVTREAVERRGDEIARGFAASFTLGAGQFCTKPGLIFVPEEHAGEFADAVAEAIDEVAPAELLNERIRAGYDALAPRYGEHDGVRSVRRGDEQGALVAPSLYATSLEVFLADADTLAEERFGPSALIVAYPDVSALPTVARTVGGTLTSTVHAEGADDDGLATLVAEAARQSGRLIWNGWPTGVAVSPAMTHGGPYPATTAPSSTSVGTAAIERFLRPITFQGFPQEALPEGV